MACIEPLLPKPLKYARSVFFICKESIFTRLKSMGRLTPVSRTKESLTPLSSMGMTIILLINLNLILELF